MSKGIETSSNILNWLIIDQMIISVTCTMVTIGLRVLVDLFTFLQTITSNHTVKRMTYMFSYSDGFILF